MTMLRSVRPHLVAIVVLMVVMAALGMAWVSGFSSIIGHLGHADIVWLLLIVSAQAVAYWSYVIPYKYVFKMSYGDARVHAFEGFQPFRAGGGTIYDLTLHRPKGSHKRVLYLGLWEYAALAPAVLIAAIYALINSQVPIELDLPWIIGVPLGAVLFLFGVSKRNSLKGHPKIYNLMSHLTGMVRDLEFRQIAWLLLGMLVYWSAEIAAVFGALQLFDIKIGLTPLIIAYATGYAVTRRNLPLGGAGIVLISMALALHWVGATLSLAILAALAYQISNLVLPLVFRRRMPLKT